MNVLLTAIQVESLKLRRSAVLWGMLGFFLFVTVIRIGEGDAAGFLQNAVFMFASVFGLVGFGALAAWVFGREYTDRTMKDLLALPVSRGKIVAGKFLSVIQWGLVLTVATYSFALLMCLLFRLEGFSADMAMHYLIQLLIICGLQLLLCGPVVFVAIVSRGYLAPLAYAFCTLMVALITGSSWLGAYLPWSVPALQLAGSGSAVLPLGAVSYIIPAAAGILGLVGTWAWVRWTDQR